ncbi:MAG TPA: NAD(P)H nitroreductase [Pseudonocardia sp.]|jgi:nitroreductase|nr:NAD(P)H nitroreductase [Pseudonocardia sp.]
MTSSAPADAAIHAALELAIRAPSLHNSQPWRWRVGEGAAHLYLDSERTLPAVDPQNRELIISCGAALHHLVVALSGSGWSARVTRLPDPLHPAYLARVQVAEQCPATDSDLAAAIPRRRTDRRRFGTWPVPAELIGELTELAHVEGLTLRAINEPDLRWKLYRAMAEAAEQQAADPAHAAELADWSGRGTGALDGVPAAAVPAPARISGQPPMRPFAGAELEQPASHGEPESSALLLLSTPLESPLQWLRAGEVTSAALLIATRDGLAASPLTQVLEVADTREYLRAHLAGAAGLHPQILLRIGWPAPGAEPLAATPRRPLAEVVAPAGDWHGI